MRRSFYLFIIFVIITGIQPALAQSAKTLDLELASDEELTEALEKADDIELINKDDDVTGATTGAVSSGQKADSNEYLDESRRLVTLAEEAFSEADYDKSALLADEAASLAEMAAQPRKGAGTSGTTSPNALPATYTVRAWSVSKDCFWNIAGFSWVYGNPYQWRTLYNANKTKLPNPNNPNVIEPGTVLDIPSIKGEVRQGAWESGKTYEPL